MRHPPLTTLFYSEAMFGSVSPAIRIAAAREYQKTLLCAPDFPFVQDGTRRDADFRARQHSWYVNELSLRGIPFLPIMGPMGNRLAFVGTHLRVPVAHL